MIFLFVTRRGAHTFKDYLKDWTGELAPFFQLRCYEDFMSWPADRPGTYVFSDLERLTEAQLALICDYAEQLQRQIPAASILNPPQRALRRLALLRALHREGINQFRAWPIRHLPPDLRYPVFLRLASEHAGPASQLLHDRQALWTAIAQAAVAGSPMDDLIAVEYCETKSPDGHYRKYSAFRLGERIIPAHIIFSPHWVAKEGPSTPEQILEEDRYRQQHPHEAWIRRVFDLAELQYGRIDYGLMGAQPQVWEINSNPILVRSRAYYAAKAPDELPAKENLAQTLGEAFLALNVDTPAAANPGPRTVTITRLAAQLNGSPSPC